MRAKLIHDDAGERVFAVILDSGERVMDSLRGFARQERIGAAQVTGIGAFESAELAFWQVDARGYTKRVIDEQTEVLSLIGDVVHDEHGDPAPHLHAVLGRSDMTVLGGHFVEGVVRPTLELIVTEADASRLSTLTPGSDALLIVCSLVRARLGQLAEIPVGPGFFLQRRIQQRRCFRLAEFHCPALERAVARDLIVLDCLRR